MAKAKAQTLNMIPDMRTFECKLADGSVRKITVPAKWKTTFGPCMLIQKGASKNSHGMHQTHFGVALRFYEGSKDNIRAVYTDVCEFRDIANVTLG